MTVFRARLFQPSAIVAHEVAETPGVRIPGVLNERREMRRVDFGQPFRFTGFRKRAREQQGTGIVVDTVAVRAVCHRMNRVLEQSRIVTQRQEMPDPDLRNNGCLVRQGETRRCDELSSDLLVRRIKNGEIALRRLCPRH